ncbi:hypothetical protein DFH27DRAFT_123858 [Peziza echinospora]|nr:hypothetical protein DFH27DRAFT_123858 [Peziza echinospora]
MSVQFVFFFCFFCFCSTLKASDGEVIHDVWKGTIDWILMFRGQFVVVNVVKRTLLYSTISHLFYFLFFPFSLHVLPCYTCVLFFLSFSIFVVPCGMKVDLSDVLLYFDPLLLLVSVNAVVIGQ